MSNRKLKLRMWRNDDRCHWCKRPTKLLNIPEISGRADPLMATVDHLVSRYSTHRWVKREKTKVLACYECNKKREVQETASLSKEEMRKRSKGFSLNPRGKPIFVEAMESLDQVLDKMAKHGIIPFDDGRRNYTTSKPVCVSSDTDAPEN